jgi:cytochrome c biogenesis protein CcdA/thiol-disulfide isomerase/thioredoxin
MLLLFFAFVSGVVTILSPCILPVLPIVLSGSTGGKKRPLGVVVGFVASFSIFTLALSALIQAFNINPNILRIIAVVIILIFGLILVIPKLQEKFELLASRFLSKRKPKANRTGFSGGLLLGTSLGLVWTPCVGPIMASVISLAITQNVDSASVFIILAYSLGTALPMLGIMFGGRKLIAKFPTLSNNSGKIQRIFGIFMIIVGLAIATGLDRQFQTAVLRAFPNWGTGITAFESSDTVIDALDKLEPEVKTELDWSNAPSRGKLANFGIAPELVTTGEWFNLDQLDLVEGTKKITMEDLKGKVVLLDFWTYSCVNCVRTIPYLASWYETYKDDGLVIIGVHTPEFAFERNPQNVQNAMKELGVTWPVVLDNNFAQWSAYNNRYWPAHYFIDVEGQIRYFHFGEGKYDDSEKAIRNLLAEAKLLKARKATDLEVTKLESQTPETYLGYDRTEGFASPESIGRNEQKLYSSSAMMQNAHWALEGSWNFKREYINSSENGSLDLGFYAKNVFLVIEPEEDGGFLEVLVDGKPVADTPDVKDGILYPKESRLYHLVALKQAEEHTLRLNVKGRLRLFAFTFG